MLNLTERRLAIVTPKEAASILAERNTYGGQRPLRQSHVDCLAGKMRDGLFHSAEIIYAKLPDGRWMTLNGQHTCLASVQSGIPFNASIYGYECQTEADLFVLFSEIDCGMRRSQIDITRAGRQTMSPQLREISTGSVGLFGAAIQMAPKDNRPAVFRSRSVSPQKRVAAVCENPDEACFLNQYHGWLLLNLIAARMAMVATFRADAERARLFWDGVIQPSRLPATDPRSQLHKFLLSKECRRSSAFAVRQTYSVCVNFWNAHATGGDVAVYDVSQTPVAMKPTTPAPAAPASAPSMVRIAPRTPVPSLAVAKPSIAS